MAFYNTIDDIIRSIKTKEISYRNLHQNIYLRDSGTTIEVPYNSIIRNYLPYFKDISYDLKLTSQEITRYKFKPKTLSYDLYGTTELWSALLELNSMYSLLDFNLENKIVRVFDPKPFMKLLNEIMIFEGILK